MLDHTLSDKEDWYNTLKDLDEGLIISPFDSYGNYRKRTVPEPVLILPKIGEPDPTEIQHNETNLEDLRQSFNYMSDLNKIYLIHEADTTMGNENDNDIDDDEAEHVLTTAPPEIEVKKKPINYDKYRPYFLHANLEKVRRTFQSTTQYATNVMSGHNITQTIQSPYPAQNIWRRCEPVASDTIFAETPAVDTGGQTMAQLFIGRKSLVIDVYGMSTEKEFVNTLEDVIRKRGAMDKLVTDSARVEISRRVKDILRSLCIDDWQSEANYQHQNFAERRWKHLKRNVSWVMNWRNVDSDAWLLCTKWVADVMNHTAEKSLDWRPPLQVLTGQTIDISIMLCFMFWDVVYFSRYDDADYRGQVGSKKSSEIRGRFVGFAWNVGHALTFKVLTDDSNKVLSRSQLRLAKVGENNLKLDVEAGAVPERIYIQSKRDSEGDDVILPTIDMSLNPFTTDIDEQEDSTVTETGEHALDAHTPMDDTPLRHAPDVETVEEEDEDDLPPHQKEPKRKPGDPNPQEDPFDFGFQNLKTDNPTVENILPPEEMIDRTFLMPPQEDGSRVRAKIVKMVQKHKDGVNEHPEMIKFKCLVNNDYEEVVAYNDIVDFIEQDQTWDGIWKFRKILKHKSVKPSDPMHMGSRTNVQVEWETGEIDWQPLHRKDKNGVYDTDPVTTAIYARENKLLDTPGWKLPGIKKHAKTHKRMIRAANQAKLHSFRTKPIFMYGFQVPRNHNQAMELDKANGNSKWQDSEEAELKQIDDYSTFLDIGKGRRPGPDYKRINVHIIYAVKHDGRHKSRLVAGGHLTETPIDSVYSSVVSLRGIRMLTFLSELNDLETWATDIGNAYLESVTKEKVYIVAGPEFGEREGHTLVIQKALYGLKSSGLRWHERFADVLRSMKFFASKAEPDIWMRDKGDHYEYIGVYVDDLLIVSKEPQSIIDKLTVVHKFKLKGTGPVSFHLGCDFFRDEDGVLCYAPRKYIEKMLDNYKRIYGTNPRQATSPLVKGDHPELDTSELLDLEETKIYQSLIGALQWTIQIGRFDIATAVMTMSRFRAAPRRGHLERIKRIHGYLSKMRHGIIRIRTDTPDFSDTPEKKHEWFYTCYSGAKEELPRNAPRPLGKSVKMSSYVDANLYHDLISGRSVTGILHMFNATPIDWFSKLQSTVETATFGSECVAARTCTEQIIDLRNTLRYLGVPIDGAAMMFGDNETVVNTASVPHSRLHKRHNALSYHRTREAIAAGITRFYHIRGETNPSDILSKHWDYPSVWPTLKPLMFWRGDTAVLSQTEAEGETLKEVHEDTESKDDNLLLFDDTEATMPSETPDEGKKLDSQPDPKTSTSSSRGVKDVRFHS